MLAIGRCRRYSLIKTPSLYQSRSLNNSATYKSSIPRRKKRWFFRFFALPITGLTITYLAGAKFLENREIARYKKTDVSFEKISVTGPWQVQVISSLPLRSISRLWGTVNSLTLPVWLRDPLYRTYAWLFDCNLKEMEETDLKVFPNLSSFFYRKLKPGLRPLDNSILISPADGKLLHYGLIQEQKIEQIKGNTYDLSALVGIHENSPSPERVQFSHSANIAADENFAIVNGINYSVGRLIEGKHGSKDDPEKIATNSKAILPLDIAARVRKIADRVFNKSNIKETSNPYLLKKDNALYFCVIYLAPGDYHRFHSPTNWIIEKRRHFAGELFSVSPFMLNYMPNLFTVNERVSLIGKWTHGFFCMVPVGATNVGSIKINFDSALRTNNREVIPSNTFTEVSYSHASEVLGGLPMPAGEEMGGFCLGSTIVLIFEAPKSFKFTTQSGEKVRVGQALGSDK